VGIIAAFLLHALVVIPVWRIFRRAGFSPWWSLTVFIPIFGWLIAVGILAWSDWKPTRA